MTHQQPLFSSRLKKIIFIKYYLTVLKNFECCQILTTLLFFFNRVQQVFSV
jgi:hypothetical protein